MAIRERRDYYPNMDLMRYVMALGVIIAHFNLLCGGDVYFPISSYNCVGGFFAISGFLIFHTYHDKVVGRFVKSRAERILPSYVQVVLLAAVGLCLLSDLGFPEYFTERGFWYYLAANLSFLNWLQPDLPGVFDTEQFVSSAVNGSLWTMKVEWMLYLSVPLLIWIVALLHLRRIPLIILVVVLSIGWKLLFCWMYASTEKEIYNIMGRQVLGQLSFFYMGALLYMYRYLLRRYLILCVFSSMGFLIALDSVPYGSLIFGPPLIAIIVIGLSVISHTPGLFRHRHNVSYEMYLSHWPLLQVLVALGLDDLPKWQQLGIALMVIVIVSVGIHFCSLLFMKTIKVHK